MKSVFAVSTLGCIVFSALACGAPASSGDVTGESTAAASSELAATAPAAPASKDSLDFDLYLNPKFASCIAAYPSDLAHYYPQAHVHVQRGELNDELTLAGKNIKPGLKFDMFTVERSFLNAQAAVDPAFHGFGLAWYQSDLEADWNGKMDVTIKTILLDQIFGFDTDVNLEPRNTFHVGFWFNDPQDAVACGFDASKPTPFNGDHKAGPLAMISVPGGRSNLGPLCTNIDWSVTPARCIP
jgi:hypothetical protein